MKRHDRHAIVLAAGAAMAVAVAGMVSAAEDIRGTVAFEGGAVIPRGQIEITLDPAGEGSAQPASTRVASEGKSEALDFLLPALTGSAVSPGTRIVARLEREDGWLLARGSARITPGAPVQITLHAAMY